MHTAGASAIAVWIRHMHASKTPAYAVHSEQCQPAQSADVDVVLVNDVESLTIQLIYLEHSWTSKAAHTY